MKPAARRAARALRDGLSRVGAEALAGHVLGYLAGRSVEVVGGYWPIGSEIDPRVAMRRLRAFGAVIALPETTAPGTALRFRVWNEGDALLPGRFGTQSTQGARVAPDVVLVPLLAFDRRCHRLGYGGGYYDRTLAAWPTMLAIGCAYAAQELAMIPTDAHDIHLTAIATEQGLIEPRG